MRLSKTSRLQRTLLPTVSQGMCTGATLSKIAEDVGPATRNLGDVRWRSFQASVSPDEPQLVHKSDVVQVSTSCCGLPTHFANVTASKISHLVWDDLVIAFEICDDDGDLVFGVLCSAGDWWKGNEDQFQLTGYH